MTGKQRSAGTTGARVRARTAKVIYVGEVRVNKTAWRRLWRYAGECYRSSNRVGRVSRVVVEHAGHRLNHLPLARHERAIFVFGSRGVVAAAVIGKRGARLLRQCGGSEGIAAAIQSRIRGKPFEHSQGPALIDHLLAGKPASEWPLAEMEASP